ncbi:helix-turn-helix domain-containing protein [Prochlorococcus sp. MIT 0916]|uniref:helix-turn-helix domain-containing protein n=1 Tax=Prochlorococcus sp. MIT 0916 TaxID=3082521 RepID=UPI0039B4B667
MTSFTCVMAWLCALLMVPLMLFIWALDTKRTIINRYRSYRWSWRKIADIYGVSPTTVRRWSMA